jgi:phage-related minor tail protein
MNKKLEKCCADLKKEIETAETGLANVGHHLDSAMESEMEALELRLKEAASDRDARHGSATQAIQRIKDLVEEKKSGALASLEEWKTNREIAKIEKHVDKSEQQAVDAIMVAAFAILDAEIAVLEALKARKIAIEVAG